MILDQQYATVGENILDFPDWVFADLPAQPNQIKETVFLGGSANSSVSLTGDVDAQE